MLVLFQGTPPWREKEGGRDGCSTDLSHSHTFIVTDYYFLFIVPINCRLQTHKTPGEYTLSCFYGCVRRGNLPQRQWDKSSWRARWREGDVALLLAPNRFGEALSFTQLEASSGPIMAVGS